MCEKFNVHFSIFTAKVDEFKREKNLQLNDLTRHYELLMAEIDSNLSSSHREEVRKLKEQHANDLKEVKRKQWVSNRLNVVMLCFRQSS